MVFVVGKKKETSYVNVLDFCIFCIFIYLCFEFVSPGAILEVPAFYFIVVTVTRRGIFQ